MIDAIPDFIFYFFFVWETAFIFYLLYFIFFATDTISPEKIKLVLHSSL